jgi:hypothetical protein
LNSFMTTIFNGAQATPNDEITKNGQKFYPLLIPVIITMENSPAQPNLVIESPVTNGLTSSVKFAITGLSTTAIIDKDITFYFTVSGAAASDYTVTGANVTNYGTLPDGSGLYSDTIEGSHNHEDDPTEPALATISITYTGSTPTPLTVTLAPDGPLLENNAGDAYYVGQTYGNQYDLTGQPAPYAPPSQPLIGSSGLSQEIKFANPTLLATKPASAAIDEVGGGSATDLLGRFDSPFSMAIPETHNSAFEPDTWLSLVSSAETYSGAFAHHQDGNPGGARDAWGIGVGWNDLLLGHGPGPGA